MLDGGARKPLGLQLKSQLIEWIYDRRPNGMHVSRKCIMAKTKYFYRSEYEESEKSHFVASNGLVNNFLDCNGSSLCRKATTAQQDSEWLIDKLILYILHACRLSIKSKCFPSSIIAMDETTL